MRVVTAEEMRELDRRTIEEIGLPGVVLMENAGAACERALCDHFGADLVKKRVGIVCGTGNNGGDGFVMGRRLKSRGVSVRLYLVGAPEKLRGDALLHYQVATSCGVEQKRSLDGLVNEDVVVDALLGTGLTGVVAPQWANAISAINRANAFKLAVDIPSGLDANTGHPARDADGRECVVHVHRTVTMALAKQGLVTSPGFSFAGELLVADIGIPARFADDLVSSVELLDVGAIRSRLPKRSPTAHKGTGGHVLVVAGSPGKVGAALLAGEAALRGGAGLVTLACRQNVAPLLAGRIPEVMTATFDTPESLLALAAGKAAVAIGPGIPTDGEMAHVVEALTAQFTGPLVLDADALNLLASRNASGPPASDHSVNSTSSTSISAGRGFELGDLRNYFQNTAGPRILTPHPGEMARLMGISTQQVQSDRIACAAAFASQAAVFIALKGSRTVVAAPDGKIAINPTGNPLLATGGSGDALTGLVTALLSQGLTPFDALTAGAFLHGRAADLAAYNRGMGHLAHHGPVDRGVLITEVLAFLPDAFTLNDGASCAHMGSGHSGSWCVNS